MHSVQPPQWSLALASPQVQALAQRLNLDLADPAVHETLMQQAQAALASESSHVVRSELPHHPPGVTPYVARALRTYAEIAAL